MMDKAQKSKNKYSAVGRKFVLFENLKHILQMPKRLLR